MGIIKFIVDAVKEGADEARAEIAKENRDKAPIQDVELSAQREVERRSPWLTHPWPGARSTTG